jgi:RNase adaptor protein for sRNA GlmZ degradation
VSKSTTLTVVLRSVGFKTAAFEKVMKDTHFIVDCRGVLDPSHKGMGSGDNVDVQDYVFMHNQPAVQSIYGMVESALNCITSRRSDKEDMWKDPFNITFVCAHGIHRSRATKHIVARWLKKDFAPNSDLPVMIKVEVE